MDDGYANYGNSTNTTQNGSDAMDRGMTRLLLAFLCLVVLAGMAANLLVCIVCLTAKELHKAHNIFLVSMAVADILVFIGGLSTCFVIILERDHPSTTAICYITSVGMEATVLHMTLIALNRFASIFKTVSYKRYFTISRSVTMALVSWLLCIALVLPSAFTDVLGNFEFVFEDAGCKFKSRHLSGYIFQASMSLFVVYLPSVMTVVCYVKIYRKVRKSRLRVQAIGSETTSRKEVRLATQMFFVLLIFYLSWTPYVVIVVVGEVRHLSSAVYVAGSLSLSAHCFMNPLLYFYYEYSMRKEAKRLFQLFKTRLCGKSREISPADHVTDNTMVDTQATARTS